MTNYREHMTRPSKELCESIKETASLSTGVGEAIDEVRSLRDRGCGGVGDGIVQLGVALVLFPEPTMISDVAGCGVIVAGMAYNRLVPPPLYVDDIFETIREQVRAIREVGDAPSPIEVLSRRLKEDNR